VNSHPSVITLLTDFGVSDAYVGQVKGAILAICPQTRLVDLTHEIPAGQIRLAASLWADAVDVFPSGTVHLGVVDPGVGSPRRPIAAEIGQWRFVCPDNGLLSSILAKWPLRRAVELTDARFRRSTVSPVFHGRDLFGPAAAHLAQGVELNELGPVVEMSVGADLPATPVRDGAVIRGTVLSSDRFGNIQTDIPAELFAALWKEWLIEIAGQSIDGISQYYGEQLAGTLMAVIGSNGRLEIAMNQGHAAQRLGTSRGAVVVARLKHG